MESAAIHSFIPSSFTWLDWVNRKLQIYNKPYIQGMTPIAKIAIAISILIKFVIAIAILIAIWKKIADLDRDRSFAITDRDHFTYCW